MRPRLIFVGLGVIAAVSWSGLLIGCGGDDNTGPLGSVDALVILQRPKRNDMGDIFQYTSYIPGARLVKLSPPTADGKQITICCDKAGPEYANIDISSYDISFDAKEIVFSGRLKGGERYGLFRLTIASGAVVQIATDPGRSFSSWCARSTAGSRIRKPRDPEENTGLKHTGTSG